MEQINQKTNVPTLILAVLNEEPAHGYAIARKIEERSKNVLQVGEGSLYPILKNLERQGFVVPHWETGEGPARKVYTISTNGQAELARLSSEWVRYRDGFDAIMGGSLNGQLA